MKRTMRKKCLLCSVLFAGMLALTGCGETPYELEDNEREIIVNYAAHIIAKYNKKQPEGYRYVYVPEEEEEEPEEQPEDVKDGESPDTPEDGQTDTAADDGTQKPEEPAGEEAQEPSVTLSEALGLTDVRAVYTGAELTDRYDAMMPEAGKKLMVLHVTLQNDGSGDVDLDMVSMLPTFRAIVNGTEETSSELTILPDDLGTWEGTVPAGGSVETVIFFQISDPQITSVQQLEMKVTAGEKTSRVVFL